MKLQTVRVTHFRSVDDSEEFKTEQVTCLVGKNEAGKSAILLALAALNPHASTPAVFDKERDYPRRALTQYDQLHPKDDAVAITTTWALEPAELAAATAKVGAGVLRSEIVTVSRAYGQDIEIEALLESAPALNFLYDKFNLDASERSVLSQATTTTNLITTLPKLASPTAKHQALQGYLAQVGVVTDQVSALIRSMLPKLMYFSSYDRMNGAVQLETMKDLISSGQIEQDEHRGARLFTEFLDYAGCYI